MQVLQAMREHVEADRRLVFCIPLKQVNRDAIALHDCVTSVAILRSQFKAEPVAVVVDRLA